MQFVAKEMNGKIQEMKFSQKEIGITEAEINIVSEEMKFIAEISGITNQEMKPGNFALLSIARSVTFM